MASSFKTNNASILLLGDAAVGKTSLKNNFVGHGFRNSYLNTIGLDLIKKSIEIDENHILNTQIWDMGANSKPSRILQKFIKKVSGAMIIFDLTRYETFLKINHWIKQLIEAHPKKNLPILLIGNKIDLEREREIPKDEIEKFVEFINQEKNFKHVLVDYIETSARTGKNVKWTFEKMSQEIFKMQNTLKF